MAVILSGTETEVSSIDKAVGITKQPFGESDELDKAILTVSNEPGGFLPVYLRENMSSYCRSC